MTKNIQFRILLIFLIIGIAFIVGISCYSISILENLKNMQNQVELQQNLTNQIENLKVNVRLATVDKFADNLKKYDSKSKITATDFLTYNKEHITNYARVDEKK